MFPNLSLMAPHKFPTLCWPDDVSHPKSKGTNRKFNLLQVYIQIPNPPKNYVIHMYHLDTVGIQNFNLNFT